MIAPQRTTTTVRPLVLGYIDYCVDPADIDAGAVLWDGLHGLEVAGPAGSGKTTLAYDAALQAYRRGWAVAWRSLRHGPMTVPLMETVPDTTTDLRRRPHPTLIVLDDIDHNTAHDDDVTRLLDLTRDRPDLWLLLCHRGLITLPSAPAGACSRVTLLPPTVGTVATAAHVRLGGAVLTFTPGSARPHRKPRHVPPTSVKVG